MNGKEALGRLLEGNGRYQAGGSASHAAHAERRAATAGGQKPFAIILGCSDSRVPVELIFDAGIGDIFVVRVAGGVLGDHALGSIEYAALHLETPLLLVLGHTGCGAVTAAVSGKGGEGHIGSVLGALGEAVESAAGTRGDGAGGEELVEAAVRENALITARRLRSSRPVLEKLVGEGALLVKAALYDMLSGAVSILD